MANLKYFSRIAMILSNFFVFVSFINPCRALEIFYPSFPSPDQSWNSLLAVAKASPKVKINLVLNINNGPGASMNALYSNGIQKLSAQPNIRFFGHIDTRNGNCFNWAKATSACTGTRAPNKVSDVYAQMALWTKWYGVKKLSGFYFENFLPYNGAAKSSPVAVLSVLKDYGDIYSFVKRTYPGYIVVGNPGLLNPRFKSVTTKVADVMTSQQAARSFLANPSDATQGSFAYYPSGYGKAFVATKIVFPVADAKVQIVSLLALAKKWGVSYFVAVRDFKIYPSDIMGFQVSLQS